MYACFQFVNLHQSWIDLVLSGVAHSCLLYGFLVEVISELYGWRTLWFPYYEISSIVLHASHLQRWLLHVESSLNLFLQIVFANIHRYR